MNYFLYPSAPGCWLSYYFICLWYHFVSASLFSFEAQKFCSQTDRYIRGINSARPVGFRRAGHISLCYSATMVSQQYTWISNITQGCCLWKIFAIWTIGGIAVIPCAMLLHYIFFLLSFLLISASSLLVLRFIPPHNPPPHPPAAQQLYKPARCLPITILRGKVNTS